MKFSARLTLSTVAPAVLFSTALVVSLVGMFRVEHTYAGLLAREERLASGASSLYAEGLQMGQALRNIALDPADAKAKDNLQKAADAAAIAGAREIPLSKDSVARVKSAALSYAAHALTGDAARDNAQLASLSYSVAADVVDNSTAVKVDITEEWTPFFAHFVMSGVTPVTVSLNVTL